jgi:PAS domain S-box-containing protein
LDGPSVALLTTALQRAAAESREKTQLRDLLEALPAAVYTTDADGLLTFYNEAAAMLWGCRPQIGEAQWCGSWRLYWPDGSPMAHEECPMAITLKEGRAVRGAEAMAERPDGTRVPFIPYPTPLHDAAGNLVGAVNMLVDITERKQAEERQKALVDELNHRVKNMLATVQSLAALSLRAVPADARKGFETRLFALSRTHDHLTREQWQAAELGAVIRDIFGPYQQDGSSRVRLSGGSVRLRPQAALTLAMVLNELGTNAAKYGALSTAGGMLDLSWSVEGDNGDGRLVIEWRERGGPPVRPPRERGFGTRLVERGIVHELDGTATIDFAPEGVRCTIAIPLASSRA